MRDTDATLSTLTIAFHWIVALTMISLIAAGIYMSEFDVRELYPVHKSIGVLIFFVVLARVYWRVVNGWPKPVGDYKDLERKLARLVHWVLILGTVIMPISGFIMSAAGGYGVSVFGLEMVAANVDPIKKEAIPHNASLAGFMHEVHEIAGFSLIFAILLHIAGALKHHIIYKDGTLRRMMGK